MRGGKDGSKGYPKYCSNLKKTTSLEKVNHSIFVSCFQFESFFQFEHYITFLWADQKVEITFLIKFYMQFHTSFIFNFLIKSLNEVLKFAIYIYVMVIGYLHHSSYNLTSDGANQIRIFV